MTRPSMLPGFSFLLAVMLAGCGTTSQPGPPRSLDGSAAAFFEDVTGASGLDFVHDNGMVGDRSLVEIMGSGAALIDYDRDGDLDAYLLQGHSLGEVLEPGPAPVFDQLYRNDRGDWESGGSPLRFTRVTEASGIRAAGYGMAAAVGDYDRDGWPDLYVANWGDDQLWRNMGDGTFEDRTAESGLAVPGWSSAASFFDYDGDGWQDLYVVGYLELDLDRPVRCSSDTTGEVDYCSPAVYPPTGDRLYRNLGDGSFEDVTVEAGIARVRAHGLGLATADFDGDGRLDVYVANDGDENQLWLNRDGARFEDVGPISGSAVNMEGNSEASMGVSVEDFDADGDPDILLTHLADETNTFYRNDGKGFFEDATRDFGLVDSSRGKTSFGVASIDLENDGWLDLVIVNGAVAIDYDQAVAGDPLPLRQHNQILRNLDGERFEAISDLGGPAFARADVYRGAATGDLDNDGDLDLLITRNNGPALVLRNRVGQDAAWLGVQLREEEAAYDLTGVSVRLEAPGEGGGRHRWTRADGSYGSSRDPRVLFGLGEASAPGYRVEVRWPDGTMEWWQDLAAGRYHQLVRGRGHSAVESSP